MELIFTPANTGEEVYRIAGERFFNELRLSFNDLFFLVLLSKDKFNQP